MKTFPFLGLFGILLLLGHSALAQESHIHSERPGEGYGVHTLDARQFQLENGLYFGKKTVLNEFMLRYGVTNSTEIRLLAAGGKIDTHTGLRPITFSLKQHLFEQNKILPAVSLFGDISFGRLASKDFQNNKVPYEIGAAFENTLSDKFALGYNFIAKDKFEEFMVVAELEYEPSHKWGTLLEYVAELSKHKPIHELSVGATYLVQPQLQLDLIMGHTLFADHPHFYTSVGLAYRFR